MPRDGSPLRLPQKSKKKNMQTIVGAYGANDLPRRGREICSQLDGVEAKQSYFYIRLKNRRSGEATATRRVTEDQSRAGLQLVALAVGLGGRRLVAGEEGAGKTGKRREREHRHKAPLEPRSQRTRGAAERRSGQLDRKSVV